MSAPIGPSSRSALHARGRRAAGEFPMIADVDALRAELARAERVAAQTKGLAGLPAVARAIALRKRIAEMEAA